MRSALLLALVALIGTPVAAALTPNRPVVFIPGILGSNLCDSADKVIWGSASSIQNLTRLSLVEDGARNTLKPCGIVKEIQMLGPIAHT